MKFAFVAFNLFLQKEAKEEGQQDCNEKEKTSPDLEKNIFCELWKFGNTDLAEKPRKLRQI